MLLYWPWTSDAFCRFKDVRHVTQNNASVIVVKNRNRHLSKLIERYRKPVEIISTK